jgi:hypothetical protein
MLKFAHDIAGGQGNLIVTALQSPNFLHDVSGWQIARNGDAEFNDLVIRGTFLGADFEVTSAGAFFYSGTPAAGNLIISIATAAGSDPYSNPYSGPGVAAYGPNGSELGIFPIGAQPVLSFSPPGTAHQTANAEVFSAATNAGLVNELLWLVMSSGKAGHDDAAIQLFSESADGTIPATVVVEFGGTVFCTITKTGIVLPGNVGTPAAVVGSASIYGTASGALNVVDGIDSQAYATERRSMILQAASGSSSTTFGNFFSASVASISGTRSYRIHGLAYFVANQTGGKMAIKWTDPTSTVGGLLDFHLVSGTASDDQPAFGNASSAIFSNTTMTSGQVYAVHVDGVISVPQGTSTQFELQFANQTSGDTFHIAAQSFVDIMPV